MALQSIVFPWLPHLGLRMEEVLDDARSKVKTMFRAWRPSDGLPDEILAWKDVSGIFFWLRSVLIAPFFRYSTNLNGSLSFSNMSYPNLAQPSEKISQSTQLNKTCHHSNTLCFGTGSSGLLYSPKYSKRSSSQNGSIFSINGLRNQVSDSMKWLIGTVSGKNNIQRVWCFCLVYSKDSCMDSR